MMPSIIMILLLICLSAAYPTFAQEEEKDPRFRRLFDPSYAKSFLGLKDRMVLTSGENATLIEDNNDEINHIIYTFTDKPARKKHDKKKKRRRKKKKPDPILEEDFPTDLIGDDVHLDSRQVKKSQEIIGPDRNNSGFKDDAVTIEYYEETEETSPPSTPPSLTTTPPSTGSTTTVDPFIPDTHHLLPLKPIDPGKLFAACHNASAGHFVCFGYPDGCISTRTCRMAAALSMSKEVKGWIRVVMAATAPRGFVALGFSEDRFMGDDTVVHCNNIPKSKFMTLHLSLNVDYHSVIQKNPDAFHLNLKPIAGYAQDNGVIACEFLVNTTIRPDNPESQKKSHLLKETHRLFLAFGRHSEVTDTNSSEFGELRFHHMTAVSDDEEMSTLFEKRKILSPRTTALLLTHIIPYTLAFSFFIPCAMFIAKYGREAYGDEVEDCYGMEWWLLIHAVFQSIAVFLSIVGLIGIVQELGGEWRSFKVGSSFHSVTGLLATVFLWVNFILGGMGFSFLKKKKKNEETKDKDGADDTAVETERQRFTYHYFKWSHWYCGHSVYWLGMGALVVAHEMRRATIPCIFMYIVLLQIFVHCVTHVVMSFHTSWLVKALDGKHWRRRVYPGPMIPWTRADLPKKFPNPDVKIGELRLWCGRRRAVIFYFITCFFCCVGLLGLLCLPEVLCRQVYDQNVE